MANKKANTIKRFVENLSKEVADAAYNGGGGDDGYVTYQTFYDNINGKKLSGEKFLAFLKKYNVLQYLDTFGTFRVNYVWNIQPGCNLFDADPRSSSTTITFKLLDDYDTAIKIAVPTVEHEEELVSEVNSKFPVLELHEVQSGFAPIKFKPYWEQANYEESKIFEPKEIFDLFVEPEDIPSADSDNNELTPVLPIING